ncbi:pyridoxamine kinase [Lactococcus nasutitermitis]|uniref:pyridoxal kinase n=1 Tax=Lactococcus nasutitermitis TaxID=1652957 RepID=A0ABV9JD10_9LACT|nr:pyridoxamine kinase [Lactococcus nasutitermitis]
MSKNVLAVHDISCIGRCSLTVALPIISSFGVETRLLPTALLSTHTGGFTGFTYLDLTDEMRKILEAWEPLKLSFDSIYSGFMASAEQIDVLKGIIREYKTKKNVSVVDPVMADNGELYGVFDADFVKKMAELIPFADVLTPNITEACLLTDTAYREVQDAEFIAELIGKLREKGAKSVVLTGVTYVAGEVGIAVSEENAEIKTYFARQISGSYHGTGDVFGSVLTAKLVAGEELFEAAKTAVAFVIESIKATPETADKRYGVEFEQVLASKKF